MSEFRKLSHTLDKFFAGSLTFAALYCLGAVLAVVMSFLASQNPYFPGDIALAHLIQSVEFGALDATMWSISATGETGPALAITALSAFSLWAVGRRLEGYFTLGTLSADAFNVLVKELVQRPRPSADLVRVAWVSGEAGFPSGHVVHFVVFFGFLFFLARSQMRPSRIQTAALILFGSLVALVGVSRIYLGAHWPSDVAGGYLVGGLWLTALIRVYAVFRACSRPKLSN